MKNVIYILIQCTWGLPQTLLGFIVLLINIKNKHYFYHGAIITERNVPSNVSLGMFVFTTTNPMKDKRTKNKIPDEELSKRLFFSSRIWSYNSIPYFWTIIFNSNGDSINTMGIFAIFSK